MYLVEPLVSGFGNAPLGEVEFYSHGTLTNAVVFSDYDGLTVVTDHTLNGAGQLVRYVNEVTDVIVRSAAGSLITSFTTGDTSSATEIRHAIATGTSPTGQQGQGLAFRTTLDEFLTNLYISLGQPDGKVDVNGAAVNIKDAIAGTTGVLYNVTSTSYGATGDGSTDDTTSIQAAITAASDAGGGIVYFPTGTYVLAGSLLIGSPNIWLLGAPGATFVQYTTGILGWVDCNASATGVRIDNITFSASATGKTGNCIRLQSGANGFRAFNCTFTGHNAADISCAALLATFTGCRFTMTEASSAIVLGGNCVFIGCDTVISLASASILDVGPNVYSGGNIYPSASGGSTTLVNGTSPVLVLSGVNFGPSGGQNLIIVGSSATSPEVWEAGCRFADAATTTSGSMISSQWRDKNSVSSSTAAGTYTADIAQYGVHDVIATVSAAFVFPNPTGTPREGMPLILKLSNITGNNFAPTFGTDFKAPAVTVLNTQRMAYIFVYDATAAKWHCAGDATPYTA